MKITFENISKSFGSFQALSSIDLEINDGELFFLLGPSGCGKTTLLRCLGGFETPESGKILLDGKDAAGKPPYLRNTAMVFQGYALWPHLTVEQNIAFGLEMKGLPKEEIARKVRLAMDSVQISSLGNRKPNELSGGQQQRVALARTLVVQPGCLLLDEPLANLDAKLRRDMRREIRQLCKNNRLTAVYVTHDRQEALSMADKIAVLKDGRIVQCGTPRDIYCNPINSFVANFIGETNFLPGKLVKYANGRAEIETAAGLLHSTSISPEVLDVLKHEEHPQVTLSIRPEAISLESSLAGDDANRLDLQLSASEYQGEISKHIAHTVTGGLELSFLELNPRGAAGAGKRLPVYFARQDLRVLV